jgi:uncharacterized membrane protein
VKTFIWLVMAFAALAVAGYSATILLAPEIRPPFVGALLAERPFAGFVHLAGGAVALVAGALQLNSRLRALFIDLHRWSGRVYLVAVVSGGVAALALSVHSSGGVAAHAGFGLLAVLWTGSAIMAYRYIKQGQIDLHRNWMVRSYALTLAAVTLRVYLPVSVIAGFPMSVAYPAIAWLCWVPNLLLAEWFIRSRFAPAMPPGVNRASPAR